VALMKDIALVLRRLDYSETSQVLAVLTREHGQQRLIAKGVKRATKKGGGHAIDLLELGEVVFSLRPDKDGALAVLTEWRQRDTFPALRSDLAKCYAGQYAAEVTAQLTEAHDPHAGLFDGLLAFLHALETEDAAAALVKYLWLLLKEIGLRPDLGRCVNCGQPVGGRGPLYFSSREGGAICRDCEPAMIEKRRIPPAVAEWLGDGSSAGAATILAAFDLLDYHLTEIMSRPPKVGRLFLAALRQSRT